MSQRSSELTALLQPAVAALGLELLGLEWSPSSSRSLLRLYIDAPGRPVTVEDCEAVSREVEAVLDVNDPIKSQYTLEVSSPGIDRPLFTPEQVARHVGEEVRINLALPLDGRRRLTGKVTAVEGDTVVLDVDGAEQRIDFSGIEKARIVPDLVALGIGPTPAPKRGKGGAGRKNKP